MGGSTSGATPSNLSTASYQVMPQVKPSLISMAATDLQAPSQSARTNQSLLVGVASAACLLIGSVLSLGLREFGLLNFALGERFGETEIQQRTASAYDAGEQSGRDAGFAEGQTAGYSQGEEAGREKGYAEGYEEGKTSGGSEGYDNGYAAGLSDGEDQGYDNGYYKGEQAGYEAGKKDGYSVGFSDGCEEVFDQASAGAVVAYSPSTRTYGRTYVLKLDIC
jgi:flagellar biosynthesis/type III secretory pathway protein FliH